MSIYSYVMVKKKTRNVVCNLYIQLLWLSKPKKGVV